ncbi:MAG TPA: dockerin type I domain-containing protein, partial [Tepidisphaeraceae bacterium]|nr:dockerin type I domain-containing protein [Tepidisphaeraceae bacterium]
EQGFGGPAAQGTGLPTDGVIVSAANPSVAFQLQPYTADNVAFVQGNNGSITLQLTNPGHFASLSFLGAAANGSSGGQIRFNFADGSSTSVPFTYGDWFNNPNPAYIAGGRVLRSTGAAVSLIPGNPRLYELDYNLVPTDQLKVLNSVTFQQQFGNSFGVFAVSGTAISFLPSQSYPNALIASNSAVISARGSGNVSFNSLSLDSSTVSLTGDPATSYSFGPVTLNGNAQLLLPAVIIATLGPMSGPSLAQSGSGTLILTGANNCGQFSLAGGTMVFQSGQAVTANSTFTITGGLMQFAASNLPFSATLSGLSITAPGKLDLTDNSLLVTNPASDPQAQVQSCVMSGAVYSSLADANHALGYVGWSDDLIPTLNPNSMLVKLTVPGDTNLDGTVDLRDFQRLSRHFGQTSADWADGDFNYDGTVSLSDLLTLTRHFGQHYTTPVISPTAIALSAASAPLELRRRSTTARR